MGYGVKRPWRWVATNAFSRIMKTKIDERGETRWLFKDMDLTDEEGMLSKVLCSLFFYLFLVLFGGIVLLFYQLLLLDITFLRITAASGHVYVTLSTTVSDCSVVVCLVCEWEILSSVAPSHHPASQSSAVWQARYFTLLRVMHF